MLLALLILLVTITVHEFGHYVAGKALKFKINEFAIGFGPKIIKRKNKKNGELFSVRAFPLGGFCAFEGEDEEGASENAFNKKAPWKRIIVLAAGVFMNYILALLLIMISMFAFGQSTFKIQTVAPYEGTAQIVSFEEGDLIVKAEGSSVFFATDIMGALNGKKQGETADFTVMRGGELKDIKVTMRADCNFENSSETTKMLRALGAAVYGEDGNLYLGMETENVRYGFFDTIGRSFLYSFGIAGSIFKILGELLTGHLGLTAMGGPVTTIKLTSQMAAQGFQSFLTIASFIGVNFAVFNLLPIPALDGSKIVFCLIEWIFRKPVPRKVEAVIHVVGFVLLIGFSVLVDILQFAHC